MKKIAIAFGVIIVAINLVGLVALYFLLRQEDSIPQFTVITADVHDSSGILNIPEYTMGRIAARNELRRNIDAEMAVRIAQMVVFDRVIHPLYQPYLVFHDIENDFFIVLARFLPTPYADGILRILVCARTGGILDSTMARGGVSMPRYLNP